MSEKNQIDAYYKEKLGGLLCTQDCQDIVQVIVCYVIRQHFWNEKVEPKLPKAACRRMRAEIIHAFINDELHSWNPQQQVDQEEHVVEANKADKKTCTRRQK